MATLVDRNTAVFNVLGTACLAGTVWLSISAGQSQLSAPPVTLKQVPPPSSPLCTLGALSRTLTGTPVSRAILCPKSTESAQVHRL